MGIAVAMPISAPYGSSVEALGHGAGGGHSSAIARVHVLGTGVVVFSVVLIYTCIVYWIFRGKVGKVARGY
jgi:hypothetical protein